MLTCSVKFFGLPEHKITNIPLFVISSIIVLVLLDKDVSSIAILLSLAWGGYKLIQGLYIKMAEREHLEEIRTGRRLQDLDTSDIDYKIEDLENSPIESEVY